MSAPNRTQPMSAPHVPAAFINAIAEEGTKDEAIFYLQKQWNETRVLKARIQDLEGALQFIADGYDNHDVNHVDYRVKVYQIALDALQPKNSAK